MPADEPGPLPHGLLGRLAARPDRGAADLTGPSRADPGLLAADLAVLRDGGFVTLALPARSGGAGLNLAEVACAQRQLAARAPATAWAVNSHHAWVGAAADTLASGDPACEEPAWILGEAARGQLFAAGGPAGPPPAWDWLAVRDVDTREPGQPAIRYGFVNRAGEFRAVARPRPGGPGSTLPAGWHAWGLSLAGMTSYAIARRAFDLAVDRACGQQEAGGGHPLDRWPVAEAALRLDGIRGQLDEVIAAWRQRVTAGGGVTSLDPGRLGLIRQFTARHAAIESARRVVELAALIAGDAVEPARA